MVTDSRTFVVDSFGEPFNGIGVLISSYDGFFDVIKAGTGFYVGDGAILTAWHVVSDEGDPADAVSFLHGAFGIEYAGNLVDLPNPNDFITEISGTYDLALVLDQPAGVSVGLQVPNTPDPTVFGLDAYLDIENYIDFLALNNGVIEAKTAGFPGDQQSGGLGFLNAILNNPFTSSMMEASGSVIETETRSGHTFVSDVPFGFVDNPDHPRGYEIAFGASDGSLDAVGGQSGSPLWTYDERNDAYRSFGVALSSVPFAGTAFEVITTDDFATITSLMRDAGVTQPVGVTNRVTGRFDNTSNEFLNGSDYADVMRGLGTGAGGKDFLRGGYGNDIYEVEYGFGSLTISEPEAFGDDAAMDNADMIDFVGISIADVRLERGLIDSDLEIYVMNPEDGEEDYIGISRQFYTTGAIEKLRFEDAEIDITNGLLLTGDDTDNTLDGTAFDDILVGLGGDDALYGRGGNNTFFGGTGDDDFYGGIGDDTYYYAAGDDADYIREDGGFDTVILEELDFADIRLERTSGVNSLFLNLYVHNGSEDIVDQALGLGQHFSSDTSNQIERLITADGVEIDLTAGLYMRGTDGYDGLQGTDYDDFLDGLDGDDNLFGSDGDDFIDGGLGDDNMQGGYGGDTYVIGSGDGKDVISEVGRYFGDTDVGPIDQILFEGISPIGLRFETDTLGRNLTIYTGPGEENYVYIPAQYSNWNPGDSPLIESIAFGTGASIDLTQPGALDNTLPVGAEQSVEADSGEVKTFDVETLLDTVEDPDPDTELAVVGVANELGGVADLLDGTISFTPDAGFVGPASFDYLVSDSFSTVPVKITITYDEPPFVNSDPVAVDDLAETPLDVAVSIDVLGNDTDVDSDPLVIDAVTQAAHGDVAIVDGVLIYTPDAGYVGFDAFTYDVVDGAGGMASGAVDVAVGLQFIPDPDVEPATGGNDEITGTNADDLISALGGGDTIDGFGGNDILNGGSGDDVLDGGFDDDRLEGRNGNDTMTGGPGDDIFVYADTAEGTDVITDFGQGNDVINLRLANVDGLADLGIDTTTSPGDTILSFGSTVIALEGFTDPLTSEDFIFLGSGTEGDDFIRGTRQNNTLSGLQGEDELLGRNGADELYGGADNDKLNGGRDADMLFGGDGNDNLNGGQDNDILYGGAGEDVLTGLNGADTMTGGADADVFKVKGGVVQDTITDFEVGLDVLNLRGTGVSDFDVDVVQSNAGANRLLSWTDGGDAHQLTLEGLSGVTILSDDVLI